MKRLFLQISTQLFGSHPRTARLAVLFYMLFASFADNTLAAPPTKLGDLNTDGVLDVFDLTILRQHIRQIMPIAENLKPFADVNGDGFLNEDDAVALINIIVGKNAVKVLPLASIRETSPFAGESGVALTREVVLRFTMPLSVNASLTTWDANTQTPGDLYAEAGGRKLLTRVELSGDRRKASLFFLEPVPASTRVTVTFDGVGINDLLERQIDPVADNLATGGVFTFTYDTAPITPVPGTGIIGHVYASERTAGGGDTPLAGALVRVVGSETLFTFTAADGSFALTPCPAGRFFVEVDGRTCPVSHFPDGGYYPYINKAWEALPGRADNLAAGTGKIYLPLVPAATLQPVSATAMTTVAFAPSVVAANPALAGVEITIPPNSLFADDGTRGGKVGLAPVASDRLPEPLPPGLNHALDISIQTDGATNFDRPVPVKFPNLPDPVTGVKLKPGEKSALWSYNHDKGAWEIVGPMTVTDDGNFLFTDVGVGVRQPGWHGANPGTSPDPASGPPTPTPPAPDPKPPKPPKPPRDPCQGLYHSIASIWLTTVNFFNCDAQLTPKVLGDALGNYSYVVDDTISLRGELAKAIALMEKFPTIGDHNSRLQALAQTQKLLTDATGQICPQLQSHLNGAHEIPNLSGRLTDISGCASNISDQIQKLLAEFHAEFEKHKNEPCILNLTYVFLLQYTGFEYLQATTALTPIAKKLEDEAAIADGCPDFAAFNATLAEAVLLEQANNVAGANAKVSAAQAAANVRSAKWVDLDNHRAEINKLLEPINQHIEDLLEMIRAMSDIERDHGGTINRQTFFRIQGRNLDLRGKSRLDGTIGAALPPDEIITVSIYEPTSKQSGKVVCRTGANGTQFHIPTILLAESTLPDTDSDGLRDDDEAILGTNPANADTDGDGILDGAEIDQGTNPLDNAPVTTGVLSTIDTPGQAKDIAAQNTVALLADGSEGVSVFNVANALNPVRTAQVRLTGSTEAVALDGTLAAATGSSLSLLDLSDLSAVRVTKQLFLGGTPRAVTAAGGVAYTGLDNGQVVAVDLAAGAELERLQVSTEPIHDLSFAGDVLYARSASRVYALEFAPAGMTVSGSVGVPGSSAGRQRLFAGVGVIYAPKEDGYTILSLADPLHPAVAQTITVAQRGWREFVPTGSGLGLGIFTNFASANLHLYDLGANGTGSQFLTTFTTPGDAQAVSIFNGLAYVADGDAGLTVVNYKAYDALGVPPTISISTGFPTVGGALQAEEGKLGRVTAAVADDVQVRNIEFYVDGQLAVADGNFPFEHRFTTPLLASGKTSFTLRAKATDTGGNSTWSATLTVNLVADATPPRVVKFLPPTGSFTGSIRNIAATFSEPINQATLTAASFAITGAGPDGVFGNADDLHPTGGAISYRGASNAAFVTFPQDLAPSLYRLVVSPPIADLAGNQIAAPAQTQFRVFSFSDSDGDGIPDDVEPLLGLDPHNPDTDGNGIRDGDEDFDHDHLTNAQEIALGLDPRNAHSNGDPTVLDGDADPDNDKLSNRREALAGTNPNKADTDGDGWNDEAEVTGGSNPLDPKSVPIGLIAGTPKVNIARLGDLTSGLLAKASILAQPSVFLARSAFDPNAPNGGLGSAAFISTPTVYVARQSFGLSGPNNSVGPGSVIAAPIVYVARYDQPAGATTWLSGTIQAQPSVTIARPNSNPNGPNGGLGGASFIATPGINILHLDISGLFIAQPPVTIEIQN